MRACGKRRETMRARSGPTMPGMTTSVMSRSIGCSSDLDHGRGFGTRCRLDHLEAGAGEHGAHQHADRVFVFRDEDGALHLADLSQRARLRQRRFAARKPPPADRP